MYALKRTEGRVARENLRKIPRTLRKLKRILRTLMKRVEKARVVTIQPVSVPRLGLECNEVDFCSAFNFAFFVAQIKQCTNV